MKDSSCQWLNFRWGLDVSYTQKEEAPILLELSKKYGKLWDGEYFYKIQGNSVILRWPDWRTEYRVDMEKVRVKNHQQSRKQRTLKSSHCYAICRRLINSVSS